jgi:hypothetical protein
MHWALAKPKGEGPMHHDAVLEHALSKLPEVTTRLHSFPCRNLYSCYHVNKPNKFRKSWHWETKAWKMVQDTRLVAP